MVLILAALLLQPPAPSEQTTALPVSLERIKAGLGRLPVFEPPPPRGWGRVLFRVKIEEIWLLEGEPWEQKPYASLFGRPSQPPTHFEFLRTVTPEETRSAILHPCCGATPAVSSVVSFVKGRIRASRQRSAAREVERAMAAAGIKKR